MDFTTPSSKDGRSAAAVAAAAVALHSRRHSSTSPSIAQLCAAHRSSAPVNVSNSACKEKHDVNLIAHTHVR
jgi:anti-sigma-K factor RskA